MIREGSKVAYVGPVTKGRDIGDEGLVVSAEASYSHVRWTTGAKVGEFDLVRNSDLVVNGSLSQHPLTAGDSFDEGLVGINVHAVYSRRGSLGLINALNEEGHLMAFPQIAEEAASFVAQRIREDPSVVEVLGSLEEDEVDDFVSTACMVVLRDAFGGES